MISVGSTIKMLFGTKYSVDDGKNICLLVVEEVAHHHGGETPTEA